MSNDLVQRRGGGEAQLALVRRVLAQHVQRRRGLVAALGRRQRLQPPVRQQRAQPRQRAPAQRHPHHA